MLDFWQHGLRCIILAGFMLAGIVALILSVAYLTLAERKVIAAMQGRLGPNRVGFWGLLQPIADGLKLLHKELIVPSISNRWLFVLAPIMTFSLSIMTWAVIPVSSELVIADLNVGILYVLALSSMGVYGLILAGWASHSKYAFLGALRSTAQMISYEVSMGFIIVCLVIWSGSLNLSDIVMAQKSLWFAVSLFPLWIIFLIASLAETNRAPFDLPEAETELAGGYNVEYSSFSYALFYLAEYANMILMSALNALFFLGGWLPPLACLSFVPGFIWLALKTSFVLFIFLWVRASLPRYRYDQLMDLGWKVFFPFTLFAVVILALIRMF